MRAAASVFAPNICHVRVVLSIPRRLKSWIVLLRKQYMVAFCAKCLLPTKTNIHIFRGHWETFSSPHSCCLKTIFCHEVDLPSAGKMAARLLELYSTHEKLRQAVPIFGAKLWNEIPGRMRDMHKKVFKRKLISVLFGILKDNDDYLDATMITREIKTRNPEP